MSAPLNPLDAARAITPALLLSLRDYDAIEVHPCCVIGVTNGIEIVETCEPADADFWSVYGHCLTGGLECLEDFPSLAAANDFAERLRTAYSHLRCSPVS